MDTLEPKYNADVIKAVVYPFIIRYGAKFQEEGGFDHVIGVHRCSKIYSIRGSSNDTFAILPFCHCIAADTKCLELLHYSRPCSSFLPLLSPRLMCRIVTRRRGNGYASCSPTIHSVALSELMMQTFNSLGQSPCTVIGYMMSTCSGRGELFQLSARRVLVFSSLLQNTLFFRCSRDTCTLAQAVLTTPTCASAALSGIRSLAPVAHARSRIG
jgi:hypothetical protein